MRSGQMWLRWSGIGLWNRKPLSTSRVVWFLISQDLVILVIVQRCEIRVPSFTDGITTVTSQLHGQGHYGEVFLWLSLRARWHMFGFIYRDFVCFEVLPPLPKSTIGTLPATKTTKNVDGTPLNHTPRIVAFIPDWCALRFHKSLPISQAFGIILAIDYLWIIKI